MLCSRARWCACCVLFAALRCMLKIAGSNRTIECELPDCFACAREPSMRESLPGPCRVLSPGPLRRQADGALNSISCSKLALRRVSEALAAGKLQCTACCSAFLLCCCGDLLARLRGGRALSLCQQHMGCSLELVPGRPANSMFRESLA